MKKIEFRGKSTMTLDELESKHFTEDMHSNGWFTGNLVWQGNRPWIVGDIVEADSEYVIHEFWVSVHSKSVGQYTGLKDKNNKKIYSNDIIHMAHPFKNGEYKDVIVFENGAFKAGNFWMPHFDNPSDFTEGIEYVEVIGNTFENSDLLI